VAAPFRYPLPVPPAYSARFRPPFYSRNVLYASGAATTALYEHAYQFLRQRIHLRGAVRESGFRTAFELFIVNNDITDLRKHRNVTALTDRRDYGASHAYILSHPQIQALRYPSCREPQRGDNYAVFAIAALAKTIGEERTLSLYFDPPAQAVRWMDLGLTIAWAQVS
jgi:hypothetical protein